MDRVKVWVQSFGEHRNLALQWHEPGTGQRKTLTTGTRDEAEAERKRGDKEYELNNGLHREKSKTTWKEFRAAFEEEFVATREENTRKNYATTLDHFEDLIGVQRLEQIDARAVSRFITKLRDKGRKRGEQSKPSTLRVRRQFLLTALRWAHDQGMMDKVPKVPGVKVPDKVPQPVPETAVKKLLDTCKDDRHMRAFLLCAWEAGLRRDEAYRLCWESGGSAPWVDLASQRIRFPAEGVKAKADQWVPLSPVLAEALAGFPRTGESVFDFGGILSSSVCSRIRKLANAAGVRVAIPSYKALRRGFGCRYAAKVSAHVLQKLMRHSNIAITLKYYANVDDAVMQAVLREDGKA